MGKTINVLQERAVFDLGQLSLVGSFEDQPGHVVAEQKGRDAVPFGDVRQHQAAALCGKRALDALQRRADHRQLHEGVLHPEYDGPDRPGQFLAVGTRSRSAPLADAGVVQRPCRVPDSGPDGAVDIGVVVQDARHGADRDTRRFRYVGDGWLLFFCHAAKERSGQIPGREAPNLLPPQAESNS
jgi:hypothetical protein